MAQIKGTGGTQKEEDNIGRDIQIEIHQLANGYLVRPYISPQSEHYSGISHNQEYVFESFQGLIDWLSDHFSHRKPNVRSD